MDTTHVICNNGACGETPDQKRQGLVSSIEIAHSKSGSQLSVQVTPVGSQPHVLLQVSKAAFTHALNLRTNDFSSWTKKKRNRKKNVIHIKALVDEGDPQERSRTEEILYWRLLCGDKLIAYDSGSGASADDSKSSRVWQCKACGAAFATSAALRAHRAAAHAPNRAHACVQCGATFARSDTLRAHARVHTGERPFLCERCGATFAQAVNLRQHARVHAGLRTHRCAACCASFAQLCNLKKHERVHTVQSPQPCPACGVVFAHAAALKRHARKHAIVSASHERAVAGSTYGRTLLQPGGTSMQMRTTDFLAEPHLTGVDSTERLHPPQQYPQLAEPHPIAVADTTAYLSTPGAVGRSGGGGAGGGSYGDFNRCAGNVTVGGGEGRCTGGTMCNGGIESSGSIGCAGTGFLVAGSGGGVGCSDAVDSVGSSGGGSIFGTGGGSGVGCSGHVECGSGNIIGSRGGGGCSDAVDSVGSSGGGSIFGTGSGSGVGCSGHGGSGNIIGARGRGGIGYGGAVVCSVGSSNIFDARDGSGVGCGGTVDSGSGSNIYSARDARGIGCNGTGECSGSIGCGGRMECGGGGNRRESGGVAIYGADGGAGSGGGGEVWNSSSVECGGIFNTGEDGVGSSGSVVSGGSGGGVFNAGVSGYEGSVLNRVARVEESPYQCDRCGECFIGTAASSHASNVLSAAPPPLSPSLFKYSACARVSGLYSPAPTHGFTFRVVESANVSDVRDVNCPYTPSPPTNSWNPSLCGCWK